MKKDFLTEEEFYDELDANRADIYTADASTGEILDSEDYCLDGAEQGFMIGYLEA
jgi:hypothetical protein